MADEEALVKLTEAPRQLLLLMRDGWQLSRSWYGDVYLVATTRDLSVEHVESALFATLLHRKMVEVDPNDTRLPRLFRITDVGRAALESSKE